MRVLFACKRTRPDIQLTIVFLSTRVREPDKDDWKKLQYLLKYLKGTINMVLTLLVDNIHVVKWWVDGAFAVHANMRSHTGVTMTLGKGSIYSALIKQKVNTRSSTKTELHSSSEQPHDRVEKGEVNIEYCPAEEITGDFCSTTQQ
eukprot:13279746-Ditylum_brightwellii.AAC.1